MKSKRKWLIAQAIGEIEKQAFADLHPLLLQLLINRGLRSREDFETFLQPRYESLSSPYQLMDMDRAVERILRALATDEQITIYADYDADAVTACAVLYRALRKLGAKKLDYYIPDRFTEGYGMNIEAMELLAQRGSRLIITVDCGITAVEETARAVELGMNVIITDHHIITRELPRAIAVVNPKRNMELAALHGLTGVGVAFKFVHALFFALFPARYAKFNWQLPEHLTNIKIDKLPADIPPQWEKWLLDLVAIGTIADCQSLMGENRILVSYGLKVLNKTKWTGLRQLLQNAGYADKSCDTFTCGFVIAPRINAAGRIQHADIAFRLLSTDDPLEAARYAGELESLNSHRQRLTDQIFSEARQQVEAEQLDRPLLLVVGENWPKGVVGLVASRLTEEYSRPAVVLEQGELVATGSARSVGSFNIVEAFMQAREHLVRFGGHSQAAGLTIENSRIAIFHQQLLSMAEGALTEEDLTRQERIDIILEPAEFNYQLLEWIKLFEPVGPDNPPVRLLVRQMLVESIKTMGNNQQHIRLEASGAGKVLKCVGFRQAWRLPGLSVADCIDMILEPSENVWNGRTELQLKIIDLVKN